MNQKHDQTRHLIVTENTPISLSQLLGQKTIPANSLQPRRFIITLKPRTGATNLKLKTNALIPSLKSEINKVLIKAVDIFKGKSLFESPCPLRNTILEKIDELSEGSLTSIEPKIYDLKSAKPSTNIERLRGGWGNQRKNIKDRTRRINATDKLKDKITEQESKKSKKKDKPDVSNKKAKTELNANNKRKGISPIGIIHHIGKPKVKEEPQQSTSEQSLEVEKNKTDSNEKFLPAYKDKEKLSSRDAALNILNLQPLNSETCAKIDDLEKQLDEMSVELRNIRKEILEPNDFFKIKLLSQQFQEVTELLLELKINCLNYQNMQNNKDCKIPVNSKPDLQDLATSCAYQCKPEICRYEATLFKNMTKFENPTTTCTPAYNDQMHFNPNISAGTAQPAQVLTFQCNQRANVAIPATKINKNLHNNRQVLSKNCTKNYFHHGPQQYHKNHQQSFCLDLKTSSSQFSDIASRSCAFVELPVITSGLSQSILQVIGGYNCENISLTVVLEANHLYHINISVLYTSQSLGCIYATETAFNEALKEHIFDNFITFFVLNSKIPVEGRNKILNYSVEVMNSRS